ncbi:MAG: TlpA family protein disulfide reductase [Candidatus Kapaibacterium sp.]
MRFFLIFFIPVLFFASGCIPSTDNTSNTNNPDTTLQFKNNISALYGMGGKIAVTNTGPASNIIWKDSLGVTQSLDSLRGKKILLNFWALWCVYCDQELPALKSISQTTDIVVIGVNVLDEQSSLFDRVKFYDSTQAIKFQLITDALSKTYVNYGGTGTELPWSFAIDRQGNIAYKFVGAQTKDEFMSIMNQIP